MADDKTLLGPLNDESVAAKMDRHMDDARPVSADPYRRAETAKDSA
jgi:hypothetical protein